MKARNGMDPYEKGGGDQLGNGNQDILYEKKKSIFNKRKKLTKKKGKLHL